MSVRTATILVIVSATAAHSAPGQKPADGRPVAIRLATLAPTNSSWHKALLDMGAEWKARTSGRLTLTVHPDGTQGGEGAVIRMMRPGVDQMQAALFMLPGLSNIDDAFGVFGLPFFFESDAEATHVLQRLTPLLDKRLDAKGFRRLAWGSAGWIQLFSKTRIDSLAKVKSAKLFTSQGDDRMVQWYKANGFRPVALSANDIPAQLKLGTGLIDAAPSPPYPAQLQQFFRDAPFMLDVRVAPLYGALVVTAEAWARIEARDRPVVEAAAAAFESRVLAEAPKLDRDAIEEMKKRKLTVVTLDPRAMAEFRAEAERLVPTMRGTLVPPDVYDAALRERDAFRKTRQ
jgi:TRAP-type C4-dicarboxylate transport system substrate-binding protein